MFPPKSTKFTLTLVCYVALALVLTDVAQAKDYAHVPARRDHADLNRMIRKRGLSARDLSSLFGGGANGVGNDPPSPSVPAASSSGSTLSSVSSISPSPSSSQASDPLGLNSIFNPGTQSPSSSPSSSPGSSSSSTSLSSSLSTPATTPSPSPSPSPSPTTSPKTSKTSQSTDYETVTDTSGLAATNSAQASSASTNTKHTTITIIIVVASCVAGVAIIWTLIRKWKFRPSAQFEDRMQPIDWQPAGPDDGPELHRTASNASHGSFHSSSVQGDGLGPGSNLDHDFTAGPAHLAPVGGYADLARGPSPQPYRGPSPGPQMQEALVRGPSLTRPTYDQYGVPLHHQGAYANDHYSGITGTRY